MSAATDSTGTVPLAGSEGKSRVGLCYVTGPAYRPYRPGDRDSNVHRVISDEAVVAGCVTVENEAGQRFPVPASLVDQIAGPGETLP